MKLVRQTETGLACGKGGQARRKPDADGDYLVGDNLSSAFAADQFHEQGGGECRWLYLYFVPEQPAGKAEANWIKTNPGQGFMAALRLQ